MNTFLIFAVIASYPLMAQQPAPHEETLQVPSALYPLDEKELKLSSLLIQSVRNDSKGIVDAKVQSEIFELMKQIQHYPIPPQAVRVNP